MKTANTLIALAAGLLAAASANAGDAAATQALSASAVVAPAIAAADRLHPRTEATISQQIAEIDLRLTATLAGRADAETQVATGTELALSVR